MLQRLYQFWFRIRALARRRKLDQDLEEELRFHIEAREEQLTEDGARNAYSSARRRFGNPVRIKEESRQAWTFHGLEQLWSDCRYAVRTFRRSPGFTLVATLTLALGIGGNTAIFSVVHSVLLQSLPYPDSDRIVRVYTTHAERGGDFRSSVPDYLDWKARTTTLEAMEGYRVSSARVDGDSDQRVSLLRAGPGLLDLIGTRPVVGRLFQDNDTEANAQPVVVLAYEYWRNRYGGDPDVVGQSVRLDERRADENFYTIIGVADRITGPLLSRIEAILPWVIDTDRGREMRGARDLALVGRLRQGTSVGKANEELIQIGSELQTLHPEHNEFFSPIVVSLMDETVSGVRPKLIALAGATGLILLIAVANIANLFLVRGSSRRAELAMRAALGAGSGRLVRLLLTESLLLSALGGIVGLALGYAVVEVLLSMFPPWIPRLEEIQLDGTVMGVALLATAICGLLIGLVPVWSLRKNLDVRTRHAAGSCLETVRSRLGSMLVIAQLALSFVLLTGSGLMIRSFIALQQVPIGIDFGGIVTLPLGGGGFRVGSFGPEQTRQLQRYREILEHVESIPGVHGTTLTSMPPLSGGFGSTDVEVLAGATTGDPPSMDLVGVTADFFEFFGSSPVAGRLFESSDVARAESLVVVDANLGRAIWPDEPAVGQRLRFYGSDSEVIGVSEPIRYGDLAADMRPKLFHLLDRSGGAFGGTALVRHDGDPGPILAAIAARLTEIDGSLRLGNAQSLDALYAGWLREPRFYLLLLGNLGGLGLAVAAVGVYGSVAYSVARRTREIGIRMAVGANWVDIMGLFCRRTVLLVVVGVGFGLLGSSWFAVYVQSLLFEITPTDPLTLVAMAILLGATAMVATLLPMRRALRADPAATLRSE